MTADDVLRDGVARGVAPALVGMAADQCGPIFEGAYGQGASVRPVAVDSVFWIMSLTKALTATACMQLVEQGHIGIDQPAGELLEELTRPQLLEGFAPDGTPRLRGARRQITVRHLLTHTSGHSYTLWSSDMARYAALTGLPEVGAGKLAALSAPIEFEPGTRWHYGTGIDWIGQLVERVSGLSLEGYFKAHMLDPLDMPDTGFVLSEDQRRRLVTLHRRQEDGTLTPAEYMGPEKPEFQAGGSGAFSTPRDFMRFLRALLRQGELDGQRILRPATVSMMFSNQIGDLKVERMISAAPHLSESFDFFPGQDHRWGFSYDINTETGPHGRSAGSGSWAGLFNCFFWVDPRNGLAALLFAQTLPFCDRPILELYGSFERSIYQLQQGLRG